jgi:hypothetical protein
MRLAIILYSITILALLLSLSHDTVPGSYAQTVVPDFNYHVLTTSSNGVTGSAIVVFHILVPDITNKAGVSLRKAIAIDQDETRRASIIPNLEVQRRRDLRNAVYIEVVDSVIYSKETTGALTLAMDRKYDQLEQKVIKKIKRKYQFWGYRQRRMR